MWCPLILQLGPSLLAVISIYNVIEPLNPWGRGGWTGKCFGFQVDGNIKDATLWHFHPVHYMDIYCLSPPHLGPISSLVYAAFSFRTPRYGSPAWEVVKQSRPHPSPSPPFPIWFAWRVLGLTCLQDISSHSSSVPSKLSLLFAWPPVWLEDFLQFRYVSSAGLDVVG